MALTRDIIEKNLPGLTDEQYAAIVTMSQNDEETYMRNRTREIYNEMDETIASALGVPRDGAEKTYNYLERAAKVFADKYKDYDAVKAQVKSLEAEKKALQETIDKGSSDSELRTKYENVTKELSNTKKLYNDLKADFDRAKTDHEAALLSMRIDSALEAAAGTMSLRKDVNPQMAQLALKNALSTVKGFNPSFEDDGKGGKVLVFSNPDGSRMNNAENSLNPYTASELIARELKSLGVLEEVQPGKGSGGNTPPTGAGSVLGARNRVEAHEAIGKMLSAQGIVRGSDQWETEFARISQENHVDQLPIQ